VSVDRFAWGCWVPVVIAVTLADVGQFLPAGKFRQRVLAEKIRDAPR